MVEDDVKCEDKRRSCLDRYGPVSSCGGSHMMICSVDGR